MAGVHCPICGSDRSSVKNSRARGDKHTAQVVPGHIRRRECLDCETRFSTVELPVSYLETLESFRTNGTITELRRVQSALAIAIDQLVKVAKTPLERVAGK